MKQEKKYMPILVSDRLCQWLHTKGLQGYLKVADFEPHPQAAEIVHQIDVAKLTNKQERRYLNLQREGFDGIDPVNPKVLKSYFDDYLPLDKAYKTQGGNNEYFKKSPSFIVSPSNRQYSPGDDRLGVLDWGSASEQNRRAAGIHKLKRRVWA